jgi:hypothetical protein
VQEVRWDKEGTVRLYTFFLEKEMKIIKREKVFIHHRTVSAVKRGEFVSDVMSYIVLRGRWCNIIILKLHAPTDEKIDDSKHSFCEELQPVFDHFHMYHTKFCLHILMKNWGKRILSNRQFGMRI